MSVDVPAAAAVRVKVPMVLVDPGSPAPRVNPLSLVLELVPTKSENPPVVVGENPVDEKADPVSVYPTSYPVKLNPFVNAFKVSLATGPLPSCIRTTETMISSPMLTLFVSGTN